MCSGRSPNSASFLHDGLQNKIRFRLFIGSDAPWNAAFFKVTSKPQMPDADDFHRQKYVCQSLVYGVIRVLKVEGNQRSIFHEMMVTFISKFEH